MLGPLALSSLLRAHHTSDQEGSDAEKEATQTSEPECLKLERQFAYFLIKWLWTSYCKVVTVTEFTSWAFVMIK